MMPTVETLTGEQLRAAIPALAALRIKVFRDWPYLYDGDLAYEEKYLARFVQAEQAFLAVAKLDGEIVGASTAMPLAGEMDDFQEPVAKAGYNVSRVFYFAESILLPRFRGFGIGKIFFELREAYARQSGDYDHAVFCGVLRSSDHEARPANYQPLDAFWKKRGFEKLDSVTARFNWKDLGHEKETEKTMQFWGKQL